MKTQIASSISFICIFLIITVVFAGCGNTEGSAVKPAPSAAGNKEEETISFDPESVTSFVPPKKEELVNATADPNGYVNKVEVSTTLSGFDESSGEYAIDISGLSDIKNSKGEEDFFEAENKVYWQNLGDEICFEGKTEKTLPLDVRITYYLDGEEISYSDLKGKSGKLKIHFDYINNVREKITENGKTFYMNVPFLVMTLIPLEEDHFSNVEIKNGSIINWGGSKMAMGYALPGLISDLDLSSLEDFDAGDIPEETELACDVTDFELEFTANIVTSDIFTDMNENNLDSFDDMSNDIDELKDAAQELADASDELSDGAGKMRDGLSGYIGGVNELVSGINSLNSSVSSISIPNASSDTSSSKTITDAFTALYTDTAVLSASLDQFATVIPEAADLKNTTADMESQLKVLQDALSGMSASGSESAEQISASLDSLKQGVAALNNGANALPGAGNSVLSGYDELVFRISEFKDGIHKFNDEGIKELTDFVKKDIGNLIDRIKAVKNVDSSYGAFTDTEDFVDSSSVFIIETQE